MGFASNRTDILVTRYSYDKTRFTREAPHSSGGDRLDELFEKYRDEYVRVFVGAQHKEAGSFVRNTSINPPMLVAMNLAEWNAFHGIGAHMRNLLLDIICPVLIEDDGSVELTLKEIKR